MVISANFSGSSIHHTPRIRSQKCEGIYTFRLNPNGEQVSRRSTLRLILMMILFWFCCCCFYSTGLCWVYIYIYSLATHCFTWKIYVIHPYIIYIYNIYSSSVSLCSSWYIQPNSRGVGYIEAIYLYTYICIKVQTCAAAVTTRLPGLCAALEGCETHPKTYTEHREKYSQRDLNHTHNCCNAE